MWSNAAFFCLQVAATSGWSITASSWSVSHRAHRVQNIQRIEIKNVEKMSIEKKTVQCEWRHKKSIGLISWKVKIKTVLLSLCEEKEKYLNVLIWLLSLKIAINERKLNFFVIVFRWKNFRWKRKTMFMQCSDFKENKTLSTFHIGSILVKWTTSLNGLSVLVFFVRFSYGIQRKSERVAVKYYSNTCFSFAIAEWTI